MNFKQLKEHIERMDEGLLDCEVAMMTPEGDRNPITLVITADAETVFFVPACEEDE